MRFPLYLFTTLLLAAEVPQLTLAEKELFLRKAKVIRTKDARGGITGSLQATLSDGTITHDAHIQSIDESKSRFEGTRGTEINFRDSYKYNIAGYQLAKLLGLNMVPPSVQREYAGKSSAFTWWVDDVMFDEGGRLKQKALAPDADRWNRQMHVVRVFDQLIFNTDRNLGNLLITRNWDIWMIDHTRAFRLSRDLLNPKNISLCDRDLLEALRKLNRASIKQATGGTLNDSEINGLLSRRDKIVKFFDGAGDSALFTLRP